MEVRADRADAPVVFRIRLPGSEDFRFRRHLVCGGHEGLALAVDLNPDSAIDARASLVGVEGEQVALADAVEDAGDHGNELKIDVSVEAFQVGHELLVVHVELLDGGLAAEPAEHVDELAIAISPLDPTRDEHLRALVFDLAVEEVTVAPEVGSYV